MHSNAFAALILNCTSVCINKRNLIFTDVTNTTFTNLFCSKALNAYSAKSVKF